MKLKEITTDWENLFIKIKQKSNSAKKYYYRKYIQSTKGTCARPYYIKHRICLNARLFTSYEISHLFMW